MDMQSRGRSNRKPDDTAPGGVPELSPEIKRLRLKMLTGLRHMGFVEAITALKAKLGSEEKEMMRLGNLAAQTWIARQRLAALTNPAHPQTLDGALAVLIPAPKPGGASSPSAKLDLLRKAAKGSGSETSSGENRSGEDRPWRRLRIREETELNGMRFFAGTPVQVNLEDAARLLESGKAELADDPPEGDPAATTGTPATTAKPARKGKAKG
jgi:hypothetical protein